MTRVETSVRNKLGLHLRSASSFVQLAAKFDCKILVATKSVSAVDGKSILGLATLGAAQGSTLIISADGSDEAAAVKALVELVESKFHEDE